MQCCRKPPFCTPERASEIQKWSFEFRKLAPGEASMENPLGAGFRGWSEGGGASCSIECYF
jgi:hypothetical protein